MQEQETQQQEAETSKSVFTEEQLYQITKQQLKDRAINLAEQGAKQEIVKAKQYDQLAGKKMETLIKIDKTDLSPEMEKEIALFAKNSRKRVQELFDNLSDQMTNMKNKNFRILREEVDNFVEQSKKIKTYSLKRLTKIEKMIDKITKK